MGKAREDIEIQNDLEKETETALDKEVEAKQIEQAEQKGKKGVEYVIEAPNKSYNGVTATVEFKHGVGLTKNKVVLDYFKARGYKISVAK